MESKQPYMLILKSRFLFKFIFIYNNFSRSSFSEFCQRYGKDERYKAIEKVRERESLFNEFLLEVRRREKEEKLQKKEQVRLLKKRNKMIN